MKLAQSLFQRSSVQIWVRLRVQGLYLGVVEGLGLRRLGVKCILNAAGVCRM